MTIKLVNCVSYRPMGTPNIYYFSHRCRVIIINKCKILHTFLVASLQQAHTHIITCMLKIRRTNWVRFVGVYIFLHRASGNRSRLQSNAPHQVSQVNRNSYKQKQWHKRQQMVETLKARSNIKAVLCRFCAALMWT